MMVHLHLLPALFAPALALALPAQQPAPTGSPSPDPPVALSCGDRVRSFGAWSLTSFAHHAASSVSGPGAEPVVSSSLSFEVNNPVLDYPVLCSVEDGALDGEAVFTCDAPADEEQGGEVRFRYDSESGRIDMQQKWICFDDPEFPSFYTALGDGISTLECAESGDETGDGSGVTARAVDCAEGTVEVVVSQISAVAR